MRRERNGRALTRGVVRCVTILAGGVLLLPCASFADELTVDCSGGTPGAYTRIRDAIGALGPGGPTPPWAFHARHVITVLSDCVEGRIPIFDRQGLTIQAPEGETVTITAPSPDNVVFGIGGSQGIILHRLVITGGSDGIWVFDASEVDMGDCTIENNANWGLLVHGNSMVFFEGSENWDLTGLSAIRNQGGIGLLVADASEVIVGRSIIEGNGISGVQLGVGGTAYFTGPVLIRENGSPDEPDSAGVRIARNSNLVAQSMGTEITRNVGPGISADISSTVTLQNMVIEGNAGYGVRLRHMSIAELGSGTIIVDNEDSSISCDSTSLAFGDLSGVEDIECDNLESHTTLCHVPPGNPDYAQTITVDEPAVPAHLAHGDTLGPCDDADTDSHEGETEAGQNQRLDGVGSKNRIDY